MSNALDIALGASGIDLNNDGDLDVTVAATEEVDVFGGASDDTIWGAGSTATGAAFTVHLEAFGGGGDDTIASGAGDDVLDGQGDTTLGDTIDFSGATAGVNVNLAGFVATGMGSDQLFNFENIVGSGFNDSLTGDGSDNDIAPGAGDDTVSGGAGFDYIDYFDATAAVVVDMTANTATGGSGTMPSGRRSKVPSVLTSTTRSTIRPTRTTSTSAAAATTSSARGPSPRPEPKTRPDRR